MTSGVITTLGLMIGLDAGTGSKLVLLSGILVIAFADAMSDALGIHVSEESEGNNSRMNVWLSTIATFVTKLVIALSFAIPIIILPQNLSIIVAVIWGGVLLTILSYKIAQRENIKASSVITEHVSIATIVIIASYYIGTFANMIIK